MKALTMNDVDMKGKRVVMRVDVNVPIHDGVITSDKRIRAVLPTIRKALDAGAGVILLAHLGRPTEGLFEEKFSLRPVAAHMGELLGQPVEFCADIRKFDTLVNSCDVCILFYRWRKGCRIGAHFIALHRTETGILGYNTYRNSSGPDHLGDSLEAFLKQKKYFGCILIGIRKKAE